MLNLLLQYLRSWSHWVFALFLSFSLFPFLTFFFVYCPSLFLSVRIGWFLLFSHQVHWVFLLSSPFCCWVHPWVFHFSCVFQIKKKKSPFSFSLYLLLLYWDFPFFHLRRFFVIPHPKHFSDDCITIFIR